jgi:hypothetical protein
LRTWDTHTYGLVACTWNFVWIVALKNWRQLVVVREFKIFPHSAKKSKFTKSEKWYKSVGPCSLRTALASWCWNTRIDSTAWRNSRDAWRAHFLALEFIYF